jgi:hypothetical protein
MGKTAGPPPDYSSLAEKSARASQGAVNTQAMANRPDINTGFVNQSWQQGPNGQWTLNNQLGGGLGGSVGTLQGQAAQSLATPVNPMLFGPVQTGDAAREQAIGSAYEQAARRLNPAFAQREQALSARLANQGLAPGSQAARSAMGQLGTERNDAYTSALASAIAQGTQAGNATFQNNMAAQQQALAMALRQRQLPLEELQRLQGMSQVLPSFNTAGLAQYADYFGAGQATAEHKMREAEMQNQLLGSAIGALGNVAKGAASFSDARLKRNIQPTGEEALPGVPIVAYEYLWEPGVRHVGVLAQDLAKVAPRYVHRHESGYLMVDYSFLKGGNRG